MSHTIVNKSSEELNVRKLKYGLHHSYANKYKYIKRDIAVAFELLATILNPFVNQSDIIVWIISAILQQIS